MIAIVDYDAGNTRSVMNALDRLGATYVLSDDVHVLQEADRVIFPGVGHAGAAMHTLREKNLVSVIKSLQQPVLGVCVGMQLMLSSSEEGGTRSLDIVSGKVKRFKSDPDHKVPHMGWNQLQFADHPLFDGISPESHVYFVHSYYAQPVKESIASCTYAGVSFTAALQKDNFYGIQFHAEKSGVVGAKIFSNFLKINS